MDKLYCSKKEDFLRNKDNKQGFINMLGSKLEIAGYTILYANGDADTMIVKAAVECSLQINTIVVGDDTDLLVLLCYHCEFISQDGFFQPVPKANTAKHRVWDLRGNKRSSRSFVLSTQSLAVIRHPDCMDLGKLQHLRW